ncbi:MAG TPA: efflux RND transporter periplasmic adaptor subunit [Dokdonella sp.]|uniref:efflux RND transporter periplasmic adaptor subunit n=1 Tax=Dokdonella sp. TaxID=2291710 RepID=UPI0025BAD136|nr:efflux RND transporter periplasmic adaptor subunit [Dokdonella sp.]MBX3692307.1 efflux RND transporter periplasmic adaptor subunit [Dokdonella sp.]MCW5567810.1 efflux RND transporter periplasmic adaptor subunit [Dokdonella sp.]HNR92659.1 efflux RND transporter periplasmic adaptor subunit [Dokdonella sp.]
MDSKAELLRQLRIDRNASEARSTGPWIFGGLAVALLLMAVLGWWLFGTPKPFVIDAALAAPPAGAGSVPAAVLQATGYVTARRQATVSAQITGTMAEVLIEEGERVEAGQVLARLDDTAQRAALGQAEAQLAQARAQVGQYRARLDQARRDRERLDDLVGRKLVSRQAAEAARTEVDALVAQLTAQQRFVDLAEAQLRSAQVQLDYTTVRAPFAGIVIAKAAQVGEIVSPLSAGGGFTRTGVGTIVDMDSLEVEVDVNEAYINRVRAGAPAEAVLDAYQDWKIPARVIAIIPTADRGKATVKVRIGLEQKDPRVLPDMGVRVSFMDEGSTSDDAAPPPPKGVLVPATAIVERNGRSVVFVIDGARVRVQAVTPGQAHGELRLVEGIVASTRVVRAPPAEMADGARVDVSDR